MEEKFLDIPNYEGLYQISNTGKVKSLERFNKNSGHMGMVYHEKILKPKVDKNGYEQVTLLKNGKAKYFRVHRLVMMIFNPIDGMENKQVNHKDGIRNNNNLENLEWCTAKENSAHAMEVLKVGGPAKEKIKIKSINQLTGEEIIYNSITEAGKAHNISYYAMRYSIESGKIRDNCKFYRI